MKSQSPLGLYEQWKRTTADVGCVFARLIATSTKDYGQRAVTIRGDDASKIASSVARSVARFMADPAVTAATLVLPDVRKLATLTKVALELGRQPNWAVSTSALRNTRGGDVVAFRITRDVPKEGGGSCPSEALMFGPFSVFPNTRRAPVTALELFVGTAPANQPDGNPTTRAFLANIPIDGLPNPAMFDQMWEKSRAMRRRSLGGRDDKRAKAKVAFVIPMALAVRLGCRP